MVTIPKKVRDRLVKQIPRFQKILANAKNRDIHESDTVTIVVDMLENVFGFENRPGPGNGRRSQYHQSDNPWPIHTISSLGTRGGTRGFFKKATE